MTKWANADVLDNGPAYIKANCDKQAVVSAYAFGDSYATVTANILAEVAMTTTDFTLSTATNDRALTTASGKQDLAANATGTANSIVFLDTVNTKVLWVTEETSGQVITITNPVTFPVLVYTSKQPTA